MVNWTDIHKDFAKEDDRSKTYQQMWEENDLTRQDAQEWIKAGFKPKNCGFIQQWKNHNFTSQQARNWLGISLDELDKDAYLFAAYLRGKGCQPNQDLNLEQLKEEFHSWLRNSKPVHEYFDAVYLPKKRQEIIKLYIGKKNLQGTLDLSDFANLEELECFQNKLTSLSLVNCWKLKKLDCYDNQLTHLDLSNCHQLSEITCYGNNLTTLNFSNQGKQIIRFLSIGNNNLPKQDLSFLKEMVNLEKLNISNTDIDSGLEYLPEGVKEFFYPASQRPETKCQAIYDSLVDKYNFFTNKREGMVDEFGLIENFSQKLQNYKQEIARKKEEAYLILKDELREKNERISELEEELQMEREEVEKALEKAKEWRERQLKEKDQEIAKLKEQVSQLQTQLTKLKVEEQTAQIVQL